jgi:hypothetical protein
LPDISNVINYFYVLKKRETQRFPSRQRAYIKTGKI